MLFHALATFLSISSVSGLVVPRAQDATNTEIPEAITTTWVGVKNATGVYPGATPSKRSLLDLSSPVIDEVVALALSRRAGLVLGKRTTTKAPLTSSAAGGAAAEGGRLLVNAVAAQVRDIIDWTAAREAFTRATTRAMWEHNPDPGAFVAAVCYNSRQGGYAGLLSSSSSSSSSGDDDDPAAASKTTTREERVVVSVSLVSGALGADYDCLYLRRGEGFSVDGEGG
ncbi:hypothetical protein diail_1953 [Diaporthe ilicicola]|nr:hypothetical protein diail_1953 [Diaporthe ilicicola]